MSWNCIIHPGCMWSLDCSCTNCLLYTKTFIDKSDMIDDKSDLIDKSGLIDKSDLIHDSNRIDDSNRNDKNKILMSNDK
jgi:hypothetical protein